MHTLGQRARQWAARIPVFPCVQNGKKPATANGFKVATRDAAQIDAWWSENPEYNIGASPHDAGCFVLDIDGEAGEASFRELIATHGALPDTYEVRTPRGGRHLWFRGSLPSSVGRMGKNLDIRGQGGYVLLPPSVVNGTEYSSNGVGMEDAAEAPDWLTALAGTVREPKTVASPITLDLACNMDAAKTALRNLVAAGKAAIEGSGSDANMFATFCLMRDLGISEETAIGLVINEYVPHCVGVFTPDWIALKARNAYEYAQNDAGALASRETFGEDAPTLFVSSGEFVREFRPPDYLLYPILQRGFLYSLTAQTGGGKTAILLLLAANVALGLPFGGGPVETGRVAYFAGENPDEIRMRWMAMADRMGFDPETTNVYFIPGRFSLAGMSERIRKEAEKLGGFALVVVDTSAAYFEGSEENSNIEMRDHAHFLRALTAIPGNPSVVAACHPVKNAGEDNLLPRGGGSFIAEMDGNLTSVYDRLTRIATVHWQGKFRGPEFEPLSFELLAVTADRLRDTYNRQIYTVVASAMTPKELVHREEEMQRARNDLMVTAAGMPGETLSAMAAKLGWTLGNGEPNATKAHRIFRALMKDKLAVKFRNTWRLTKKGEDEAASLFRRVRDSGPVPSYG